MKVTRAVAALRRMLGQTQEQFAARLGYAVRTVARYESKRPPRGIALLKFAQLANANGFSSLTDVFLRAIREERGLEASLDDANRLYFAGNPRYEGQKVAISVNDPTIAWPADPGMVGGPKQHIWVSALLAVLADKKHEALRSKVLDLLTPVAHQWLERFRNETELDSEAAEKLLRKNKEPSEVADLLDLDQAKVERLWQWVKLSDAFEATMPKSGKRP